MKKNKKRENEKLRRRIKRKNSKKYRRFAQLFMLGVILALAIMLVILMKRSLGTAIGYVYYLSTSILGVAGGIGLIFFGKTNKIKSNMILIILVLLGNGNFSKCWNMTIDIPRYVLFEEYETNVVEVQSVAYQKGSIHIVTDGDTYEFVFNYFDVPSDEILEIDYLNNSKIGLGVRLVEEE